MRQKKDATKNTNLLIKPDALRGRIISSDESEAYKMAWLAEEEWLAGVKTAKSMARTLAKVTKDAAKLHKQAVTPVLMSLREGDLAEWVKDVNVWTKKYEGWKKGDRKKDLKPKKPLVRCQLPPGFVLDLSAMTDSSGDSITGTVVPVHSVVNKEIDIGGFSDGGNGDSSGHSTALEWGMRGRQDEDEWNGSESKAG